MKMRARDEILLSNVGMTEGTEQLFLSSDAMEKPKYLEESLS